MNPLDVGYSPNVRVEINNKKCTYSWFDVAFFPMANLLWWRWVIFVMVSLWRCIAGKV